MHFGLELGYLLPVLDQRIELYTDIAYEQAKRKASATDERLASSTDFNFSIVEQQLVFNIGGAFRFFPPRTFPRQRGPVRTKLGFLRRPNDRAPPERRKKYRKRYGDLALRDALSLARWASSRRVKYSRQSLSWALR